MTTAEVAVFETSRSRAVVLASAAALLVLGGLWMAGVLGVTPANVWHLPTGLVRALGWVGVGFFGLALMLILHRALSPVPVLVVTPRGFTDRTTMASVGTLDWDEVTAVGFERVGGQPMVVMDVRDPDGALARLSTVRRRTVRASMASTGHFVHIPTRNLGVPPDAILHAMRTRGAPVER